MRRRPLIIALFSRLVVVATCEETSEERWPFFPVVLSDGPSHECVASPETRIPMESYVDQVYSNDRKMPPGCDCRKTGDTDRECTLFECTCICDLTAGMCDHNCCCDHECTGTQRARFEDLERCEPEGPVAEEVTKCYSTKVVDRVNPRFPMTAKGTAKSSLDRMLCVRYDNSDLRGEYYEDPGYPSSSVFDDSDGQKDFDYPEWATTSLETYAKDQTYDAGDPIRAAFSYDAEDAWSGFDTAALLNSETGEYGFVEAHGGVLPLPMADERGECLETQRALFAAAQNSECLRVIDNLEADCPNLGSFRFASRLFLGKHAGASPAGSDWVHVEVRRVRWRDFEAGTEYEYSSFDPDLAACDVAYDGPFTATLAPTLSMEDTNSSTDQSPTPVPSLTVAPTAVCALGENASRPASPSCRNALVEICYVIVYGGETENSQIIRAYADLVLTDIPAMSSVTAMRQRYSIAFQSESSAVRSITDANIVNRTRSGNPGYIFGRPVLAGKLASAAYVLPRIDGLRMLGSSGDSTCSEDGVESLAVAFGVDTKSGCVLKLTRGELRDFCTGDSTHAFANGLPRYFNASADLVFDGVTNDLADDVIGIFGNADPLDPTQWLDLDIKAAAAGNAALWLERQGVCQHVITSLNYRFLWAYVGAHDNPQPKIIAARVDFGTEDIAFRFDGTDDDRKQAFAIHATATFVQRTGDYEPYSPPSPPVAISVPYDVWYPFKIESAANPRPPASIRLTLAIVASTTIILVII